MQKSVETVTVDEPQHSNVLNVVLPRVVLLNVVATSYFCTSFYDFSAIIHFSIRLKFIEINELKRRGFVLGSESCWLSLEMAFSVKRRFRWFT